MSDAIPYKQIIDRVKSDIDWIAEQAYAKGYNEAKLIYQNPNAESDYQRGLDDGKAHNEDGCIGCKYDDGTTEHSPCNYCCNAYSNQWSAKPCSNEKIKVGDEVRNTLGLMDNAVGYFFGDSSDGCYKVLRYVDGKFKTGIWNKENCERTGKHSYAVERMVAVMKEGAE